MRCNFESPHFLSLSCSPSYLYCFPFYRCRVSFLGFPQESFGFITFAYFGLVFLSLFRSASTTFLFSVTLMKVFTRALSSLVSFPQALLLITLLFVFLHHSSAWARNRYNFLNKKNQYIAEECESNNKEITEFACAYNQRTIKPRCWNILLLESSKTLIPNCKEPAKNIIIESLILSYFFKAIGIKEKHIRNWHFLRFIPLLLFSQ